MTVKKESATIVCDGAGCAAKAEKRIEGLAEPIRLCGDCYRKLAAAIRDARREADAEKR